MSTSTSTSSGETPAQSLPAAAADAESPRAGGEVSPILERRGTGPAAPAEVGGRGGLDPTRFGDWEKGGRCIDF